MRFYFDFACPYAHLAAARLDALAARAHEPVEWVPVRLSTLLDRHRTQDAPAGAWNDAKVEHARRDVLRRADQLGVPLVSATPPHGSERALRTCAAAPPSARAAFAKACFTALWVHGADLDDPDTVARLAAEYGVAASDDPQPLDALTHAAVDAGVFGVPMVAVGEQLFFGSDREAFVEQALTGRRPDEPPPPAPPGPGSGPTVRFFHDFASPFSYLGAMRIERVVHAAGGQVAWTPILLGALFRGLGTPNVPLFAFPPAKQQVSQRDLLAWSQWADVPLSWPTVFPVRTVLPLRVALQAPQLTPALYRALWVQDRDIGDPAVVSEVCRESGVDPAPLLEGAADPAVKQRLFANTQEAQNIGVCGVPTVVFPDGLLVWGQDRFDLVARLLTGWRPRPEAC